MPAAARAGSHNIKDLTVFICCAFVFPRFVFFFTYTRIILICKGYSFLTDNHKTDPSPALRKSDCWPVRDVPAAARLIKIQGDSYEQG